MLGVDKSKCTVSVLQAFTILDGISLVCSSSVNLKSRQMVPSPPNASHNNWTNYVALGDSIASGLGNTYNDILHPSSWFSSSCFRNKEAYGNQLAADLGISEDSYRLLGCASAVAHDVDVCQVNGTANYTQQDGNCRSLQPNQFGNPNLITLAVGGNDLAFSNLLTSCFYFGSKEACDNAVNNTGNLIGTVSSEKRIQNTVANAIAKAGNLDLAKFFVTGYASYFNVDVDDDACPSFAHPFHNGNKLQPQPPKAFRVRLNNLVYQCNAVIRAQVTAAGAKYVDTESAFNTHRLCDPTLFFNLRSLYIHNNRPGAGINDVNNYIGIFHPNGQGQTAIKNAIKGAMGI